MCDRSVAQNRVVNLFIDEVLGGIEEMLGGRTWVLQQRAAQELSEKEVGNFSIRLIAQLLIAHDAPRLTRWFTFVRDEKIADLEEFRFLRQDQVFDHSHIEC